MKTKLLIGWTLTVLSTGLVVSCGDDEGDDDQPSGGKAGSSSGAAGSNAGKGGSSAAGAGSGGKAGDAGSSNGGKAGSAGKAGGAGLGGSAGSSAGSTPGGAAGEGGEAGSMAGQSGQGGAGGEGGTAGGEGGTGGESGAAAGTAGTAGGGGNAGNGGGGGGGKGGTSGESGTGGQGGEGGASEVPLALLRLNELNPNLGNAADLIELRVFGAGDIFGITLEQTLVSSTVLATLPHLVVAVDDLVVVHLNGPGGVTTETTAKNQCTGGACYDAAWDVRGGNTGLARANRVISLRAGSAYQDAVPFVVDGGVEPTGFLAALEAIQTAGQWNPANCGGNTCTYDTTPSAVDVSMDWADAETTAAGDSVQVNGANNNTSAQWVIAASTFGEPN